MREPLDVAAPSCSLNAQPIDDDLGRRTAVRQHHLRGAFGEHDERVHCGQHRALTPHVADDEIRHPECRAGRPRHAADHGAQRRRHARQCRANGGRRAAMIQLARGAAPHVDDAVAEGATLPHQRAALTHEPKAAGMRGHDHAAAGVAWRRELPEGRAR